MSLEADLAVLERVELDRVEESVRHYPEGSSKGGQFMPKRGSSPGRPTGARITGRRRKAPTLSTSSSSTSLRSSAPARPSRTTSSRSRAGKPKRASREQVEGLFTGKAPAKAGELVPGVAYQGPGKAEGGARRRAYVDDAGTLHLPEGFFKQSRKTRESVILRHLGKTFADELGDGERQELAAAGLGKPKDVVDAYLAVNGPDGNAWREAHPDAAEVLDRLAGEHGIPLLSPPFGARARPKRDGGSSKRQTLQEWREEGDAEEREQLWQAIMADPSEFGFVEEESGAANDALVELLGPDLAAALAEFRANRVSWANDEGLEQALLDGEVDLETLTELAEKELAEREGRRHDRLRGAQGRGLRRRSFPCLICGRFKTMPADVCGHCGDDPVSHNATSKEIADFNASHGYEPLGYRNDPTDSGGKGVSLR